LYRAAGIPPHEKSADCEEQATAHTKLCACSAEPAIIPPLKGRLTRFLTAARIRHFHCLISPPPKPELYWSNDVPRFDLSEYYHEFD
jgi:hypothetical protein